jgi:hypothetical protein
MAINRTITLGWNGEEYEITLTLKDINELEKAGEIYELAVSVAQNQPRIALAATVLSNVFKVGGADVSAEDIYECLAGSVESRAELTKMISLVFSAIWPAEKKSVMKSKGKQKA